MTRWRKSFAMSYVGIMFYSVFPFGRSDIFKIATMLYSNYWMAQVV
jgi:hypothetical protein